MVRMHAMKKPLTRSAVEAAGIVLGIENIDTVTLEEMIAAYRKALRAAHPDAAEGVTPIDAANQIHAARAARGLLSEWIANRPDPGCPLCGGSGFTRGSAFNPRPCPRC